MSVEVVMAGLVIWIAVGLGIAFVFGTFTRRSDISDDIDELAPPVVKHIRPRKRTTQVGVRSQAKMTAGKIKADAPDVRRLLGSG